MYLGENLLQVASRVVILTDERRGTTEERVGAGRDNDTLSLALLASGTTEKMMGHVSKRSALNPKGT